MTWQLVAEDLTHLGGPMGTEYTTDTTLGFFKTVARAKIHAEKHHHHRCGKTIEQASWKPNRFHPEKPLNGWIKTRHGWRTQDLGWVMYRLTRVVVK